MSAVATRDLPLVADPPRLRLFALPGGVAPEPGPRTLDDVLGGAWSTLSSGRTADCPVCAAAMAPRWSAGAGAVGGRCASCGTTLD